MYTPNFGFPGCATLLPRRGYSSLQDRGASRGLRQQAAGASPLPAGHMAPNSYYGACYVLSADKSRPRDVPSSRLCGCYPLILR